jgi:hypothetical protein
MLHSREDFFNAVKVIFLDYRDAAVEAKIANRQAAGLCSAVQQ